MVPSKDDYLAEADTQLSDAATYHLLPDDPSDTYNKELFTLLQNTVLLYAISSQGISLLHITNPGNVLCNYTFYLSCLHHIS